MYSGPRSRRSARRPAGRLRERSPSGPRRAAISSDVAIDPDAGRRGDTVAMTDRERAARLVEDSAADGRLQLRQREHRPTGDSRKRHRPVRPRQETDRARRRLSHSTKVGRGPKRAQRRSIERPDRIGNGGAVIVDEERRAIDVAHAVAREMEFADGGGRQPGEIGRRMEPEIAGADKDVVDVAQQAAGTAHELSQELGLVDGRMAISR